MNAENTTPTLPFLHQPLDLNETQIRLFSIKQRPNERDPIRLQLDHFSLTLAPTFKALSYTWGDPLPIYEIEIDGAVYSVRQNLYDFLKVASLQKQFCTTVYFWADQICIDQDNVQERNHQVNIMAQIYSSADLVTIWIGAAFDHESSDSHRNSDALLEHIRHYATLPDRIRENARWNYGGPESDHAVPQGLEFAADRFCASPYWSRLWICQEVLLAKDIEVVVCSRVISWVELVCWIKQYQLSHHGGSHLINLIRRHEWRSIAPYARNWASALDIGEGASCSEPKDKIFGLLGLVNPEYRIQVDYTEPIEEILKMIMCKEIACTERLDYTSTPLLAEKYHKWQRELQIQNKLSPYEVANLVRERIMQKLHPNSLLKGFVSGSGYSRDYEKISEYLKDEFYSTGLYPIEGEEGYQELTEEEERYWELFKYL